MSQTPRPDQAKEPLERRLVVRTLFIFIVAAGLIALGLLLADLRFGILLGLILLSGFILMITVEQAILYALPLAILLPNIGLDIPGPFAVLMWDAFTVAFVGGALLRAVLTRSSAVAADPWFRKMVLMYLAIAALSLVGLSFRAPQHLMFGIKELLRFTELFLLLLVLVRVLDSKQRIMLLVRNLVIAGAAFLSISLIAHFWLTDQLYQLVVLEKNYVLLGSFRLRMASTAGNVSVTGMVLLILFGLTMFYVTEKNLRIRLTASLLALGLLIGIVMTYNKGTWQAIFLGTMIAILRSRSRLRFLFISVLAISLAAVFILYQVRTDGPVNVIITDLANVSLSSGIVRVQRWLSLGNVLTDRPLLGVGYNCFAYLLGEYSTQPGWGPQYGHPHNLYVDVAASTGIIGFAFFFLAGLRLMRLAVANIKETADQTLGKLSFYVRLCLWYFLAGNLTSSFFFKPVHPAVLFFTLAAITLAIHRLNHRQNDPDQSANMLITEKTQPPV